MVVDHDEMAQLLGEAEPADGAPVPPPGSAAPAPARLDVASLPEDIRRLLRLQVPVIVRLARHRITVGQARRLSLGLILEFSKQVHEDLELLVNNHAIGAGEAVKVGEKFGLRINSIRSRAARIRALGGESVSK